MNFLILFLASSSFALPITHFKYKRTKDCPCTVNVKSNAPMDKIRRAYETKSKDLNELKKKFVISENCFCIDKP
ncbi:MAG: hypothetical protein AB7I27_10695 [Bacteriovoracaceae bacterium]